MVYSNYENMIRYDPTLMDLTSNFFVLCTNLKAYLYSIRVHDNSSKTISPIRQIVAYDFWSMRHFAEYDIWSKKIVRYDIRSKWSSHCFSTKRRTRRNVASTKCHCLLKNENHKKSLCLADVQLIKACSSNFIKLLQR